jgi:serine phosphatase RsbU (regulator of sigma subunit)
MYIRELITKYNSEGDQRIIVPHLLVRSLAQELHSEKLGKYCTMLYFVYYKKLQEIHYCIAGHYPSPILVKNGKATILEGGGFPVGIAPSMTYKTQIMELEPPYSILLFSDGIFEILSGDMNEKDKKLIDLILQTDCSLEQINQIFKITTTPDRDDDISVLIFTQGDHCI